MSKELTVSIPVEKVKAIYLVLKDAKPQMKGQATIDYLINWIETEMPQCLPHLTERIKENEE